jgi:hypothetical protein
VIFYFFLQNKIWTKKWAIFWANFCSNLNSTNFANFFGEKSPTFPYCKIEKQNHELKIKNKKIALTRV